MKYFTWERSSDGFETMIDFATKAEAIQHLKTNKDILKWGGSKVRGNAKTGYEVKMPDGVVIQMSVELN